MGPLWFVIQPILTTVMFMFVFGNLAGLSTDGIPKPLFYFSGIILWNYFADCLTKLKNIYRKPGCIRQSIFSTFGCANLNYNLKLGKILYSVCDFYNYLCLLPFSIWKHNQPKHLYYFITIINNTCSRIKSRLRNNLFVAHNKVPRSHFPSAIWSTTLDVHHSGNLSFKFNTIRQTMANSLKPYDLSC